MTLVRGDNLQAFDGQPIIINLHNNIRPISKAEVVINGGVILRTFENPEFPISVELDESDTAKLIVGKNICNLIVYDDLGRKETCKGTLYFTVDREVYIGS